MGTLFVLLGPTGVGKTDLSLAVADMLGCSIISSDSRQIYRETRIGTAAPSEKELQQIRHFFIGTLSVTEQYSSGQYEVDAIPVIEQEIAMHGNTLMVGGSMLYIDAVCRGIDDIPTILPEIRSEVMRLYNNGGTDALRSHLQLLDPVYYRNVDHRNAKRMMHAIEVCWQTGRPFSSLHTGQAKQRNFQIVKIGLDRDRSDLYKRINRRVELMVESGLEAETCSLLPYRHFNALNTVGYKEMFSYIDGDYTLPRAIELIQRNTRRYAKKQLSWFGRDNEINWFHPDDTGSILSFINKTK
ncbi:MAG: tRNA (adenosine(37)-N6)-dimethylallyltransferase MiaA [Candidatus Aphodosoma sp.]